MIKFLKSLLIESKMVSLKITVFMSLLLLTGCVEHEESQLRVGTNVWPGYETLYLAREQGYLPENIKLIELLSATDTMEAFLNNRIEVAALTLDEAISLEGDGVDIAIFLVMDISNGSDTLIVREGIKNLQDLKGKRILYEKTALGALMMHEILMEADLMLADIYPVHAHVNHHYKTFLKGDVDAVITFEPVTTQLISKGYSVIFDSSHIPGKIVDVLVIRKSQINEYRDSIQTLVNGHFKTLEILKNKPDIALTTMSHRMNIKPDELRHALNGLKFPGRALNHSLLSISGSNKGLSETAEFLNQVLYETNILERKVTVIDNFDASFVK